MREESSFPRGPARSLVTGENFEADIGASSTAVYTNAASRLFLVRNAACVNDTGGAITLEIQVDSNVWFHESIPANSTVSLDGFVSQLLPPSAAVTATGNGLRVIGWGLKVQGGDTWFR